MGEKLKSTQLCKDLKSKLIGKTSELLELGVKPTIASLLIGEDGGAKFYTSIQKKKCAEIGIEYKLIELQQDIEMEEMVSILEKLNNDKDIHGIIIQAPLPKKLLEGNIMDYILPSKDIDCQNIVNIGKLYKGESEFVPCTAESALKLCKSTGIDLCGKNVVVIGRSNVVGKPLTQLLLGEHATVTICHSKTEKIKEKCKRADVIFACAGSPKMVDSSYVKEGAVIIDIGTSEVNGKITGDVDMDNVIDIASFISTVPGGVGPLTTMILLGKVVSNAERFINKE